MIDGFNEKMNGFLVHIRGVTSNFVQIVKDGLASWQFLNIGRDLVQGLLDGFNRKMDEFTRHIGGVASNLISIVKNIFLIMGLLALIIIGFIAVTRMNKNKEEKSKGPEKA